MGQFSLFERGREKGLGSDAHMVSSYKQRVERQVACDCSRKKVGWFPSLALGGSEAQCLSPKGRNEGATL